MTHQVRESGRPVPIDVNGTEVLSGNHLLGFLAATSGAITISLADGSSGAVVVVTVVDAVPVTQGIYTPIPMQFPAYQDGCTVALSGGASGTLFV